MSRTFLLIPTAHEKPCVWVPAPRTDRLGWLQAKVGGYVEHLTLEADDQDPDSAASVGASLWLNEEGLLERLPLNARASDLTLWYFGGPPLVGPVVLEVRGAPSPKLKKWLDDVVAEVPA